MLKPEDLNNFNGTTQWYSLRNPIVLTDGTKFIADNGGEENLTQIANHLITMKERGESPYEGSAIRAMKELLLLEQTETLEKQEGILAAQTDSIEEQEQISKTQIELQEEQKRILDRMEKQSGRLGWTSLGIALLSLVLSGLAAYFAFSAFQTSMRWQAEQIPVLQQIEQNTAQPSPPPETSVPVKP